MRTNIVLLAFVACSLIVTSAQAATYNNIPVAFDRWMYPFNGTAGTRATASLFGAPGEVGNFDDRDAQIFLGFDTSSIGGLAPGEKVTAATLRITVAADESFTLDTTYDDYTTYPTGDTDTGRPVEVYGVGTRGAFTNGLSLNNLLPDPPYFLEDSVFAFADPTLEDVRQAFASDYDGGTARDISNNVRDGFNPTPWAIGDVTGVAEGAAVPIDSEMVFTLDLNNPNVRDYLSAGADAGEVFLAISSMHAAAQTGPTVYPVFYLGATNGASLGAKATLDLEVEFVPEPSSFALAGLGLAALGLCGWRRRSKV